MPTDIKFSERRNDQDIEFDGNASEIRQGLAVGGRYASSPDFGDGVEYAPNRLGRPDRRLSNQLGSRTIDTGFSFYAVAGWDLPGLPSSVLPDHDFSFTFGWGNGMFKAGGGRDWFRGAAGRG